jgi:ABC-type branched-subunit amino acid transport system substrate-binding protein
MGCLSRFAALGTTALVISGCSSTFDPQPCALDSECGDGLVCAIRGGHPICVRGEDDPLNIGMSAPVTGTNQALGTGMKLGIDLAFEEKNSKGGVRGRPLVLQFRDDGYTPMNAEANARALVDVQASGSAPRCPTTSSPAAGEAPISANALERGPNAVLAFIGNVGTPTMVRAAPVAVETGTIFFGAFTGASTILRDDRAGSCKQYIFNVRASYAQEARATTDYFKNRTVPDYRHMISFDQDDTFGQAGYDGLVAAYKAVYNNSPALPNSSTPIARFRYTRNDNNSVPQAISAAIAYLNSSSVLATGGMETHSVGIMMTDTYGSAASFIKGVRDWQYGAGGSAQNAATRLKLYFSNVSFVGPNALSDSLKALPVPNGQPPYTDSVVVSQVVPNYQSDSSEIVQAYNRLIDTSKRSPGFTSLEGYVSARIFIAGLDAHKGPFTPAELVKTFEKLPDLSLGIGASAGFSQNNHQYSNSVWGTIIQPDGSFKNLYFWTEGQAIQFFE